MDGSELPRGILCAAPTPFDHRGDVDEGALVELAAFYASSGVDGLFVLGTASEAMLMEPDERRRVAEVVVGALGADLPVLLHCGTPATRSTVGLARHAVDLGVAGVAAIAPYYYTHDAVAVEGHFRAVAEAAATVPLYLYDNPGAVGYAIGAGTVARLLEAEPSIVGVKDTGDSLGRVTRYLAMSSPPAVYTGNNELIFASLAVGARGAVSALSGALPELVAAIHGRWAAGEADEALRLQLLVARVMGALADLPYLGGIKSLARDRGIPVGRTRPPQRDLTEAEADRFRERLDAVPGLAEWRRPT